MHRPEPVDPLKKPMEELIAVLEKTAAELDPAENAANQELRRTLLAAMDALNNAKRMSAEN